MPRLIAATTLGFVLASASLSLAQFREPPALVIPGTAGRVVSGDFNADGLLDLAVSYLPPGSVTGGIAVFLGTGPGTFGPAILSPTLGLFAQAATADLNGDGRTDFVAVNSGGVSVFMADGAGSFIKTFFGPEPNADDPEGVFITFFGATLADVDGDSDLDILAISKEQMGPFILYVNLNNGGGNFGGWTTLTVVLGDGGEIAAGDVNGDGKVDVMVPNEAQGGGVGIFLNDGSGAFALASYLVTGGEPAAVALADFDSDGTLDLAVANALGDNLRVYKGTGATFNLIADLPGPDLASQLMVADLDGDGKKDLAVRAGKGLTSPGSIWTYRGNGAVGFASPIRYAVNGGIWVADLNADGKLDLAAGASRLLNLGAGLLDAPRQFAAGQRSRAIAVGQLNADAKPDIVTANNGSNDVTVLLGVGDGTFSPPQSFAVGTGPTSVAVGDWNGDGALDVATANKGSNDVSVLLGNGAGGLSAIASLPVQAPEAVGAGDLNGDGRVDLVVSSDTTDKVTVFLSAGGGAFTPGPQYDVPSLSGALAVGTLNPDFRSDAVLGLSADPALATMLGNGAGGFFSAQTQPAGPGAARQFAIGDLNGDGKPDVAIGGSVLLGDGHGALTLLPGPHPNGAGTAIADFTRDGLPDVAFSPATTSLGIQLLPNEGASGFGVMQKPFAAGGFGWGLATGDFNADGHADLAVGLDYSRGVGILLNDVVPPGADVSLNVSHFPDPAVYQQTLTLTLSVVNNGPLAATGISLSVGLPTQIIFLSSTPGAPTCQTSGDPFSLVLTCSLGDLAPGGSASVSVDVSVQHNLTDIPFPAAVSLFAPIDAHPANNALTHMVHVGVSTDYTVAMTDTADPVAPGTPFSYVIDVSNQGADDNQGAVLIDTLPSYVSFVSSNPPNCILYPPLECPLGTLPAGGSAQVTINVLAGTFTSVRNVVEVQNYGETNLANNVAEEETHGALGIRRELTHGAALTEPFPAGAPAERLYYVKQQPRASYEVVVDATSGDVAGPGQTVSLQRLNTGLATIQDAQAAGVGPSRTLPWENASDQAVDAEVVRVRSTGCGATCGPGDAYRVRAYDTTGVIARFNTEGTQTTILVLENTTSATVTGHAWLWDEPGQLVGTVPFSLAPRGSYRLDLALVAPGRKGAVTVSHDGGYGALAGKNVAVEPATGFTFDTPLRFRPR